MLPCIYENEIAPCYMMEHMWLKVLVKARMEFYILFVNILDSSFINVMLICFNRYFLF